VASIGAVASGEVTRSTYFTLLAVLPFTLVARARARPSTLPMRVASRRLSLVALALGGEAFCLAWGAWLSTIEQGSHVAFAAVAGVTVIGASRAAWLFPQPAWYAEATLDARACLLFCALPLMGLARAPSMRWPLMALAVAVVLRSVPRARRVLQRVPARLTGLAAVWGLAAIAAIPLRIRDLPNINFDGHEAGQYAWINSALHGKLLMADASTIYGPLREYALVAYMHLFGINGLEERKAQVVINLLGLAVLVPVVARAARQRSVLMLLGAYGVLIGTHLYTFLDAASTYSFGWADFGRIAFPTALAWLLPESLAWHGERRSFALAAAAGLGVFYVQEVGPLVPVLVVCAATGNRLFGSGDPVRHRLRLAAVDFAIVAAGATCGALLFLVPYLVAGKLPLLFKTLFFTTSLFASGAGSLPFPIALTDFASWRALEAEAPYGALRIEYLLAPCVYLASATVLVKRAAMRAWSVRTTAIASVTLLGMASFRVAMGRSDGVHLLSVTLPAVVVAAALLSDWASGMNALAEKLAPRVEPLPFAAAGALAVLGPSVQTTGFRHGLQPKITGVLAGTEVPSSGPAYVYADVPRAGDMKIAAPVIEVVQYIRAHTAKTDAIYYRGRQTFGGEYYFLSDRRNPTRFDLPHEIFTFGEAAEALAALKRDPPSLVVTEDAGMGGADMAAFFGQNYTVVARIGNVAIEQPNAKTAGTP
jgi:hypothetical protein